MPYNVGKMTPERRAEHRSYLAQKKAESRARKKALGFCASCGVEKPRKGLSSCDSCIKRATDSDRAHGWKRRPSQAIPQIARKLRRQGLTVNDIIRDPYLEKYSVKRDDVAEILTKAGLL